MVLGQSLFSNLHDLVTGWQVIFTLYGHKVACNMEIVLRRSLRNTGEHWKHELVVTGPHLQLANRAVHSKPLHGGDELLSVNLTRLLIGLGHEMSERITVKGSNLGRPVIHLSEFVHKGLILRSLGIVEQVIHGTQNTFGGVFAKGLQILQLDGGMQKTHHLFHKVHRFG